MPGKKDKDQAKLTREEKADLKATEKHSKKVLKKLGEVSEAIANFMKDPNTLRKVPKKLAPDVLQHIAWKGTNEEILTAVRNQKFIRKVLGEDRLQALVKVAEMVAIGLKESQTLLEIIEIDHFMVGMPLAGEAVIEALIQRGPKNIQTIQILRNNDRFMTGVSDGFNRKVDETLKEWGKETPQPSAPRRATDAPVPTARRQSGLLDVLDKKPNDTLAILKNNPGFMQGLQKREPAVKPTAASQASPVPTAPPTQSSEYGGWTLLTPPVNASAPVPSAPSAPTQPSVYWGDKVPKFELPTPPVNTSAPVSIPASNPELQGAEVTGRPLTYTHTEINLPIASAPPLKRVDSWIEDHFKDDLALLKKLDEQHPYWELDLLGEDRKPVAVFEITPKDDAGRKAVHTMVNELKNDCGLTDDVCKLTETDGKIRVEVDIAQLRDNELWKNLRTETQSQQR